MLNRSQSNAITIRKPTTGIKTNAGSSSDLIIPTELTQVNDIEADVILRAFNQEYLLHELFIKRSPFFNSQINWNYQPSLNDLEEEYITDQKYKRIVSSSGLRFQPLRRDIQYVVESSDRCKCFDLNFDDDPYITQTSFELCIRRLYFIHLKKSEQRIPLEVISTANYLGLEAVVDEMCEYLKNNMTMNHAASVIVFLHESDIGQIGRELKEHCLFCLLKNGWESGVDSWIDIPVAIIADIVGKDWFYVPSEYERAKFIIGLIRQRELTGSRSCVGKLIEVLNNQVLYQHMAIERLVEVASLHSTDRSYQTYIKNDTIKSANWKSTCLKSIILSSSDDLKTNFVANNAFSWPYITSYSDMLHLPSKIDELLLGEDEHTYSNLVRFKKTTIPPIRISFCFDNLSELNDCSVISSKLFFYAGSYWRMILGTKYVARSSSRLSKQQSKLLESSKNKTVLGKKDKKLTLALERCDPSEAIESSLKIQKSIFGKSTIQRMQGFTKNTKEIKNSDNNGILNYDLQSCLNYIDERSPILMYAVVHSCITSKQAKIRTKSYGEVLLDHNFVVKKDWSAFDTNGCIKSSYKPFKICLVLGIL